MPRFAKASTDSDGGEQRSFMLLVSSEDEELLSMQRKCTVSAGTVAQLEAAVQEKLGLGVEVALLTWDADFEQFVMLSKLDDVASKAKVQVKRKDQPSRGLGGYPQQPRGRPVLRFAMASSDYYDIGREGGALAVCSRDAERRLVLVGGAPMIAGRHRVTFEIVQCEPSNFMIIGLCGAAEANVEQAFKQNDLADSPGFSSFWGFSCMSTSPLYHGGIGGWSGMPWEGEGQPRECDCGHVCYCCAWPEGSVIGMEYDVENGSLRVWCRGYQDARASARGDDSEEWSLCGTAYASGVGRGMSSGMRWCVGMRKPNEAVRLLQWGGTAVGKPSWLPEVELDPHYFER
eukprot:COSAG01_NODE_536_length_15768_cov_58.648286_10_plen_345_part_00